MRTLRDIETYKDTRFLVRVDFNVPLKDGKVTDDYRLRMAIPTIDFLRSRGGKVILISHIEASDGGSPSLKPIAERLLSLNVPVTFIKDYVQAPFEIEKLRAGECILLENLRMFPGEKANDESFAKELASLGEVYVNDAFSVSHRAHASVVGVPKFLPGYIGIQFQNEVDNLSRAFAPTHPFIFILGGAKFATKLPLLEKFRGSADTMFIGGALANDFFKAKGYEVGKSLVSKEPIDLKKYLNDADVLIPPDVMLEDHKTKPANAVKSSETIRDAGPNTMELLKTEIREARFILWNGPLGQYEKGFTETTIYLAMMISEASSRPGVTTIVGGGDTLAAISKLGIEDKFTFVSTAGGAMLDFLAKGTLPGIEALGK